jgi:S1-C subfamily serine protease
MLTEEQAASIEGSFYAPATGVYVRSVTEAADSYGKIEVGDVITALDGHKMSTLETMREYLYDLRVGDTVEVTYVREGEEATIEILLTPPDDN